MGRNIGLLAWIFTFSYIVVSLMAEDTPFNMDKLLNRGEYAIEGEKK